MLQSKCRVKNSNWKRIISDSLQQIQTRLYSSKAARSAIVNWRNGARSLRILRDTNLLYEGGVRIVTKRAIKKQRLKWTQRLHEARNGYQPALVIDLYDHWNKAGLGICPLNTLRVHCH